MQLGNNNPFSAIDNKRTSWRHVRNVTQEHILNDSLEVYMFLIITAKTKLCFERNSISQTSFHTLFDGITGRVDKIIKEFQHENVAGIRDRKIFFEHPEQTFNISFIRGCFQLEKFFKGLNLDVEQVRGVCEMFDFTEIYPVIHFC